MSKITDAPIGEINYNNTQIMLSVDDSKYVKLPDEAPATQQIVSINTDGTQQNLTLGNGISIVDGVISASGGGEKWYRHCLTLSYIVSDSPHDVSLVITTKFSDIITTDTLMELLLGDTNYPVESNVFFDSTNNRLIFPHSLFRSINNMLKIQTVIIKFDFTTGSISQIPREGMSASWDIYHTIDLVTEIV